MMIAIAAVLAGLTSESGAQNLLEKLVTPGAVIEGHAKVEGACDKCHAPFSRQSQSHLCLDCHKEIASDRERAKGLHGRQIEAKTQECRQCHTDHKGRAADITQLDRQIFNHDNTNFELREAHRPVRCESCHLPKVAYRKAPTRCFDCHKATDPHRQRLGEQCQSCHSEKNWREVKQFDHDKTKFRLEGAHGKVKCGECHVGELYKDLSATCASCHRIQDVHGGRFGPKCESCHDQVKWKPARFDHDKTKYPLRGAHKQARCESCHSGDLYRDKVSSACVSCHKKDDRHSGELGVKCERCHTDADWRQASSFDHDLTRFPLIGLHAPVPCEECHKSATFKNEPIACNKCHKDWHQTRLGSNCAACHNPNGWSRWRFDHARQTAYPLIGAHQKIACEACHSARNPRSLKLPTDCASCHRKADPHAGAFGGSCERCHGAEGWKALKIRN